MRTDADRDCGGSLWITRMRQDGTDYDVVTIAYAGEGAAKVFRHACRVMLAVGAAQDVQALRRGDLLVTLLDANGDSTYEDPLQVPAIRADWFLETWLKVPEEWRSDRRYMGRRKREEARHA